MRIFILTGLIVLSGACNEEFLDKVPQGQLTTDNFFQTEEHAIWATNAVYNLMRSFRVHVFAYLGMTDIVSDDADKGSLVTDANFLRELDDFTYDAGNLSLNDTWAGYYRSIYRANLAILNIPEVPNMDENLRARLIGENKFLRAYFYFKLVRWWGEIPLILEPLSSDQFKQARVSVETVYNQIIQDFTDAKNVLPIKYPSAEVGRATSGAATAFLAKVYLTLGDFSKAEQFALEVIQSGQYSLYPNFEKLFQVEGENSSESLFEVQATALETGGAGSQYNQVQGVRGTPNLGWGFNRPSDDLVRAFDRGDPRRDATILLVNEPLPDGSDFVHDNVNILNERYNQKAWVPNHPGDIGNGPGNIRIFRYADLLLIAAEALNENGKTDQSLTYLNQVRTRARGTRNVLPDITETRKDVLRTLIWQERRVELAMEQHRWFDLLRQGRAAEVMIAHGKNFIPGKHELFAVPQVEIDLSGGTISQNPGH